MHGSGCARYAIEEHDTMQWLGRECPVLVQSVTDRDSDNDDEDEFQGIQQACTVVL